MKYFVLFCLVVSLFFQTGCGPLKYKKVSAKDFPPDPKERIKKNMEEGRGFRILGNSKKGTNYEFASSNPLWRATLDTVDFMPLVSANYSGGIVITDWYADANNSNESIKITIRFLTNEIRSDALDVNIFVKECSNDLNNCKVSKTNSELKNELKLKILKKASLYEKERLDKFKKENPYEVSTSDNKRKKKKR
tara:strand:- start:151 stop:729 length:579 start_codon:yes stop_codon:yes gene_type:complete